MVVVVVVWPCEWWCLVTRFWWQRGGGGFFFFFFLSFLFPIWILVAAGRWWLLFFLFLFSRWLVVVVCLYLEAGGCLHFQRSNLAKHLKMFSMKIFYSRIFLHIKCKKYFTSKQISLFCIVRYILCLFLDYDLSQ